MSSAILKAHGGSKDIVGGKGQIVGGILSDTMQNTQKDVKEKHLDRLISETTGTPRGKPIMEGVIDSTIPKHMKDVPEMHKVPSKEVGKTQPKRFGQVPYAGSKY